jgi:hypothetical protein
MANRSFKEKEEFEVGAAPGEVPSGVVDRFMVKTIPAMARITITPTMISVFFI